MRFLSTRGQCQPAELQQALESGLAPDGGLYVPEVLPQFSPNDFAGCVSPAAVAHRLLTPFFEQAPIAAELDEIARLTFAFPLPLEPLGRQDQAQVLELYHGPTAAFKDVGARFLAACLQKLPHGQGGPRTILVATSGDTKDSKLDFNLWLVKLNIKKTYAIKLAMPDLEDDLIEYLGTWMID